MIVGVRGTLAATGPDWVHVTVGGVTLQVFVPSSAISALGQVGATVSLNTLLRIRDEQPTLYGFPDDASLQLFTLLTGVSGVGPRLGLALLSALDAGVVAVGGGFGRCRRAGRRAGRGTPHRQPHHPGTARQGGRHRKRRQDSGNRLPTARSWLLWLPSVTRQRKLGQPWTRYRTPTALPSKTASGWPCSSLPVARSPERSPQAASAVANGSGVANTRGI